MTRRLLLPLLLAGACRAPPAPLPPPAAVSPPPPAPRACVAPPPGALLPAAVAQVRAGALDDLLDNRLRAAIVGLDWVLAERPADAVSEGLRAEAEEAGLLVEGDGAELRRTETRFLVTEIPSGYVFHARVAAAGAGSPAAFPSLDVALEARWEASLSTRHGHLPGVEPLAWSERRR